MSKDEPTFFKIGHCPPGMFKMEAKNTQHRHNLPSSSHSDQKPGPSKCGQQRSSRTTPQPRSSDMGAHGVASPEKELDVDTKNCKVDDNVEMRFEKWNAVVFNESGEIVARTMVVRPNQVPRCHAVYWDGLQLPRLYFNNFHGVVLKDVHQMRPLLIKWHPEQPADEDDDRANFFSAYGPYRQCGGGGGAAFSFVDLAMGIENGEGSRSVKEGDEWRAFSKGLNVLGKCSNRTCVFNKKKGAFDVVIRKGYKYSSSRRCTVKLWIDSRFQCPGCKNHTFTPTNFLVCEARASFRYKKVDSDAVEGVVVESPGAFPKFSIFKQHEGSIAEYEFIEAHACKLHESLFRCLLCCCDIQLEAEEVMPGLCHHFFHATCLYRQAGDGCPICSAPFRE